MICKEIQPFKGMGTMKGMRRSGDVMGAGELGSWGDVCLGEGRRGTEDRQQGQHGEGRRRRRNAVPKAVGTWRSLQDLGLSSECLEDAGGPEQRGQGLTWLKRTTIPPLPVASVQFRCPVMSDSLRPHGLRQARPPCPSAAPGVYPNSCPLSR